MRYWKRSLIAGLVAGALGFLTGSIVTSVFYSRLPSAPAPPLALETATPQLKCTTKVFEGWDAFTQADAWAKDHPVDKLVWHEPYVLAIRCER